MNYNIQRNWTSQLWNKDWCWDKKLKISTYLNQLVSGSYRSYLFHKCADKMQLRNLGSGFDHPKPLLKRGIFEYFSWVNDLTVRVLYGLGCEDQKIVVLLHLRVAWHFQTPIRFPAMKQGINPKMNSWMKKHSSEWARCQRAIGRSFQKEVKSWESESATWLWNLTIPNPSLKGIS
jgi:hypothetical protein